MISFNIIREDIIPTIQKITSFSFTAGEKRRLAIEIVNRYDENQYLIPSGYEASITFQTTSTPVTKVATIHSQNSSIIYVDLSTSETTSFISGRISVKIVEIADPTNVVIAIRENIFTKARL